MCFLFCDHTIDLLEHGRNDFVFGIVGKLLRRGYVHWPFD